jgi:UPF0755 protein
MTRRIVGTTLLVVVLAAVLAGVVYWRTLLRTAVTPGKATAVQEFTVEPGASLRQVLKQLEDRQLVSDARQLEHYLRCCQREPRLDASQIKAGQYRIAPGQSPLVVLRQLVEGRVVLNTLTVVEGWRFSQMRRIVERHPGIVVTFQGQDDAAVMQALGAPGLHPEGRFAPDTYSFAPGTSDLTIYRLAFEARQRELADAWESRAPNLPLDSPDEALILASIVEKETGLASERARIAGVFVNRLRRGMKLQTDPTVIYGIGDRYDGNIRRSDLTRDTPYNTYTRAGLPPTPISLPGRDAIVATLNPEASDDLFFVAIGDGSGGHYFSSSLSEHNRAVQRYLERLRADPPGEEDAVAEPDASAAEAEPPR